MCDKLDAYCWVSVRHEKGVPNKGVDAAVSAPIVRRPSTAEAAPKRG